MVRHAAWAAFAVLLVACSDDRPGPSEPLEITAPVYSFGAAAEHLHGTDLSGSEEVPPRDTPAHGLATFRVSSDGGSVDFVLTTSRIENVNQAHIHCGRFGANGPVRMWLFPVIGPTGAAGPSGSGPRAGLLASGTFSPTGVVCPASAVGQDMPLLDAIRAGLTYVNVHTNDGVDPANTGPGDFPGGEIRGQLDNH